MTKKPTFEELEQRVVELEKESFDRALKENLIKIQRDLSIALSNVNNLTEGLKLCLESALQASEMDCGGIYLHDEISGAFDMLYHKGLASDFVKDTSHYEPDSDNAKLVMLGKPIYTQHQKLGVFRSNLRESRSG